MSKSVLLLVLCSASCFYVHGRTLTAAPAPAPGTEASCKLTTELEEGPYWLDDIMFRSNITEEQPGIPLLLRIKIANADCEPVVDAFVDIWQCNSTGFYSGFTLSGGGETGGGMGMAGAPQGSAWNAEPPAGQAAPAYAEGGAPSMGMPDGMGGGMTTETADVPAAAAAAGQTSATTDSFTFLRGVQQTDEDGIVEFETIVPGWYAGRTGHIHIRVHVPYNLTLDEMDEFNDSHVAHTAQFFFDATLYDQIAATYPYTLDLTTRTTNTEDRVYLADPSAVLDISYDGSTLSDGLTASMTTIIDPSSTPSPGV